MIVFHTQYTELKGKNYRNQGLWAVLKNWGLICGRRGCFEQPERSYKGQFASPERAVAFHNSYRRELPGARFIGRFKRAGTHLLMKVVLESLNPEMKGNLPYWKEWSLSTTITKS